MLFRNIGVYHQLGPIIHTPTASKQNTCCGKILHIRQGKSGGFQHRADHQSQSSTANFLSQKQSQREKTEGSLKKMCVKACSKQKGEDFAPGSGSAHISGPAGLKSPESQ